MNYEVEVHPVGDASRAGDALSIRYEMDGEYKIIIVDGGTDAAGSKLVEHIKKHYGEDVIIEHVISTHPDTDHACGLREIFKNFQVKNLWVHGLWFHAEEMLPYFSNKNWTADGLAKAIREKYPVIEGLIDLALEQGTKIQEPFRGRIIGPLAVLSPAYEDYLRLVPQFRKTPDADTDALKAEKAFIESGNKGIFAQAFTNLSEKILSYVDETWDIELLRDHAVTAAENESSTVLLGVFGDRKILLTGDAGVKALTWAMDFTDAAGVSLKDLTLVQVPHHGSRSNVTPAVLDRLLGEKLPKDSAPIRTAIVSSPEDDTTHPRKMVVNAFRRRGAQVCKTQGVYYRSHRGMPARSNEVPAKPFDFFEKVEDYD